MKKFSNLNSGFTIFVAVIVAGILTIIALSIANLSTREITLANLNRESGRAIFAANAGIECAMYWDSRFSVSKFDPSVSGSSITCANVEMKDNDTIPSGQPQATTTTTKIGGATQSVFGFSMNSTDDPIDTCVMVIVNKNGTDTTINSYGYNNCNTSDPRRVERGIEVHY